MSLSGKVAIVTGGGRGIGRAIALALAQQGASVVVAALEEDEVQATVADLKKNGGDSIGLAVDISKDEEIKRLVAGSLERYGRIDILVNVAGVRHFLSEVTSSAKELLQTWDRTIAINLRAPYLCTISVLPAMQRQGSGTIINISSISGIKGERQSAAYCSSKAALIMMTESLAQVLKDQGIQIYALCPGGVDTKMARDVFPNFDEKAFLRPEEIALAVVALVTGESGNETGSTIVVTRRILQAGRRWESYQEYFLHR